MSRPTRRELERRRCWAPQWEFDVQGGAGVGCSLHREPASECLDPVLQPDQTRPGARVGSPAAVIAHPDPQDPVVDLDGDRDGRRVGMLGASRCWAPS